VPGRVFRPRRRLSQNFLVDPDMGRRIVALSCIRPDDVVIEVGPGFGALTRHLIPAAAHVHAVELDRKLFSRLRVEYEAEPRLTLHHGDVLEIRIPDLVPGRRVVVVGNLPYAITSDLVLWMLEQHAAIRRAVVLMQREVAERLTAEPGSRRAGSLTLAVRYRAEAERILDVPARCFRPAPKVTSSLVAFRFRQSPVVRPRDEALFFRVIRAAFGERRKMLANALTSGLDLERDVVTHAIEAAGLDARIRGERLGLEDYCRLADLLAGGPTPGETGRRRSRLDG
jgi:16S rRNA (adenine1518-N6/adenine1519-N6)-dimethyltransferase